MFIALQTSDMFVMENHGALFVKQNLTLIANGRCIFSHSLQRPCLPADTQICTDPENLTLSTGIRLGPGLFDLSGTLPSKVCTISLLN